MVILKLSNILWVNIMRKIIDGKELSNKILNDISVEVQNLKNEYNTTPGLTVVLVGDDPASKTYVKNKERACKKVGFNSNTIRLSVDTTTEELLEVIDKLNKDDNVHGILVQLPLPRHIDQDLVINAIDFNKDVDGFHLVNIAKLSKGDNGIVPCTPLGVMELLKSINCSIEGKNCCVVGRSNIVGKPMVMLLTNANGTVTVCHSRTKDLKKHTAKADVLVAAIGKANFITKDMVKKGAVVIDVGINKVDGKLCGDVNFDDVYSKVKRITPVPGGVGPMTIAMLMKNTLTCYKNYISKR